MFNIRGILNRKSDQTKGSESRTSEDGLESDTSSAEGFICPSCLKAFPNGDLLQTHYESHHPEDSVPLYPCPACKMKMGSQAELHSHFNRHHSDKRETFEIEAMGLQVKALEEGKALLQDELQAQRLHSSELLKENCKVREERDALELKAATLAGELANLKADFDEVKTKKSSAESAFRNAEERIKKLEIEIQQRPEADDVTLLQQELVSVQKMMDQLTRQREDEKAQLQETCDTLKAQAHTLQAEKMEWENRFRSCPKKEEMDSLQEEISRMSLQMSELQSTLETRETEKRKLQSALEKFGNYEELKASLAQKEKELQDAVKSISNKDALILKLENEVKRSKESVEEMKAGREKLFSKIEEGEGASVAILQLKEENARLQEQFLHQQTLYSKTAHENEMKLEELRSALHKANYELQMANEKCKELESEVDECRSRVSDLRLQKDESCRELNLQIANLSASEASDKARLLSLQGELETKSKTMAELRLLTETLGKDLEKEKTSSKKQTEKLEQERRDVEKKLAESSRTLSTVRTELLEREKKLTETLKKLEQADSEKERLSRSETELHGLQELLQEKQSKLEALEKTSESSKAEFCAKISSLSEELMQAQLSESELRETLCATEQLKSALHEKCSSMEEEVKALQLSVTALQNEKNSLLSELEESRKTIKETTASRDSIRQELSDLESALLKEKEQTKEVERDLSLSKDMYLKAKVQWQNQKESLENDCAQQVSQIQQTLKQLEVQLEEAEERNTSLNSALEEKDGRLREKEHAWDTLESQLRWRAAILEENTHTLREDLSSEQKRRKDLEDRTDQLSGLKLELEAKLENALDERRGLLERCLRSEGECERLGQVASEMRRKYEDCVAALQELGRENQTLQVENMKHVTRKWADDAEVTHCTACGKLFTVTIRKHHCRNCGSIFCNECSAKTATVAASKKPVRVCDVCFNEVTK